MRRSRAFYILLALLAGYVFWRVTGRPARSVPGATSPAAATAKPVDLTKHDRQTIDFSSGKPVVKDSPADRTALDQAAQELAAAGNEVTFEASKKKAEPTSAPPAKKN